MYPPFENSTTCIVILSERNTYLHLAAERGQADIFETIIEKEDDKNPKNEYDCTPLHLACQEGKLHIIKILVENSEKWKIDFNDSEMLGSTGKSLLEALI